MPTLRTGDVELHYEDTGAGAPVLLLHGLGSSAADWAPQIEVLAPRYRVIALDARGSGRSRDLVHPAGPFSVKQFAADAAALLDHLGAAPAHVVGLSMGGMIAFQLAVDSPRHVRSLCIVNSGPHLVARHPREHLALGIRRVLAAVLTPKQMGEFLAPRLFPDEGHEELRSQFKERIADNEPAAYRATFRALVGWSVADRIGEITAPTLVVASDLDYTPVSAKEEYARQMPNAELVVIKGAHHAVPVEVPGEFNTILLAFLARQGEGHASAAG